MPHRRCRRPSQPPVPSGAPPRPAHHPVRHTTSSGTPLHPACQLVRQTISNHFARQHHLVRHCHQLIRYTNSCGAPPRPAHHLIRRTCTTSSGTPPRPAYHLVRHATSSGTSSRPRSTQTRSTRWAAEKSSCEAAVARLLSRSDWMHQPARTPRRPFPAAARGYRIDIAISRAKSRASIDLHGRFPAG